MSENFDYSVDIGPPRGFLKCNHCGFQREEQAIPYEQQADCPNLDGGQMMGRGWAGWECAKRNELAKEIERVTHGSYKLRLNWNDEENPSYELLGPEDKVHYRRESLDAIRELIPTN